MLKVVRFDGRVIGTFESREDLDKYWVKHFGYAFCHSDGYKVVEEAEGKKE